MHDTQRMVGFYHAHSGPSEVNILPLTIMSPLNDPIKEIPTDAQLHNEMNEGHILVGPLYGNHIGIPF